MAQMTKNNTDLQTRALLAVRHGRVLRHGRRRGLRGRLGHGRGRARPAAEREERKPCNCTELHGAWLTGGPPGRQPSAFFQTL